MSEEKTHHSHDRIFRHAMSLPLVARQFLETWMPELHCSITSMI